MSKLVVRNCARGDLESVTAIYAQSVRDDTASFELAPPDLGEMTRRHTELIKAGYPYLVADAGGSILGYAYAGPYRLRPAYRHTVENTVYVDTGARRNGVGRALMERLIDECEAHGFRQMISVIGDAAHLASIEFHKVLGFSYVGALVSVGYKHGKWLDCVLLQRPLGTGDHTPPERV